MPHFHRTIQLKSSWFLVGAVIVQACNPGVAATTAVPTLEPSSTATSAPSTTLTPSPSLTPREPSTATPEPSPELFAGFTQNPDIPFILFHQSGESLAALDGVDASTMKGVIWTASDGKSSIVVYTDSNGTPESAIVGDDVVFYSNFTDETVDLTFVHPDGSQETVQAERNTEVLDKLEALRAPSFKLVSFPLVGAGSAALVDVLDAMDLSLKVIGAAACVYAVAQTGGLTLPILSGACLGTILTVITTVGKALGLHVEIIEEFGFQANMFKCPFVLTGSAGFLKDCVMAALTALRRIRDSAAEANKEGARWIQHGSFTPELTEPPVVGALEGIVKTEQAYCRYGPGTGYLPSGDLFQGDRVRIEGRNYGSSWLWVQPENLDRHCWAAALVFEILGDVSTAAILQPQLPFTSDASPVTGLKATRDGHMVTITWDPSDLAPNDFRGYLLEVFTCEKGAYIWQALNPQENFITLRDDEGCPNPSGGVIYTASVRGYSQPVQIPWPK